MLVYDIEIIKAVPQKNTPLEPGVEYCKGWDDKKNMGVSVIGAYDTTKDRYRVFTQDNWAEFVEIVAAGTLMVGFNSIPFDNEVLKAAGIVDIPESQSYDLLREVWSAVGLGPEFTYPAHAGYGLDAIALANGFDGKTGHGAIAPIDWQRGNIGKVIDYCLQDVAITTKLLYKAISKEYFIDPKHGSKFLVCPPIQLATPPRPEVAGVSEKDL